MLRIAGSRLSGFSIFSAVIVTAGVVAGATATLAAPQIGHRNFGGSHIKASRPSIAPVRIAHGERRHVIAQHRRANGFLRHRGFWNPSVYLDDASYGTGSQFAVPGQPAASAPPQSGPISFADLPASTGIRPAPLSAPLFMRLSGRQVMADDGEKHLWRAGPKIVDLGSPVGQRRARHGQSREAYAGMTNPDAPKIIVIRP